MTTVSIFLGSAAVLLQASSPSATASGRVLDITGAVLPAAVVTAACGTTQVQAVRGGTTLGRHLDVSLNGENLTDQNYRLHGSGMDQPGASVYARLRSRF